MQVHLTMDKSAAVFSLLLSLLLYRELKRQGRARASRTVFLTVVCPRLVLNGFLNRGLSPIGFVPDWFVSPIGCERGPY